MGINVQTTTATVTLTQDEAWNLWFFLRKAEDKLRDEECPILADIAYEMSKRFGVVFDDLHDECTVCA
jgi:hypothetical protein